MNIEGEIMCEHPARAWGDEEPDWDEHDYWRGYRGDEDEPGEPDDYDDPS